MIQRSNIQIKRSSRNLFGGLLFVYELKKRGDCDKIYFIIDLSESGHGRILHMNEATLEQRIALEIRKCFPFLKKEDITLQKSFSIKLGHKKYLIQGRADVMIQHDGTPLAIFELKAPQMKLTTDDYKQCVSYARLTEPITPLSVISNGKETVILNTYTGKKVDADNTNEEIFHQLIKNMGLVAESQLDSAINILLGNSKEVWNKTVQEMNSSGFSRIISKTLDLEFPICEEFQIERESANELLKQIYLDSLLIFTGEPSSGKTNVIYQLCQLAGKKDGCLPVYVNLEEPKSIFQYLANKFSGVLYTPVSKDNFRYWLMNCLCKNPDNRVVFILDNISSSVETDWEEIYELIDINKNIFSVLLVMNEQIYDDVKKVKGKNRLNAIGKAKHYTLSFLSDKEFHQARRMLYHEFRLCISHGGEYNPEYRKPDVLKLQAVYIKNMDFDDDIRIYTPGILNMNILLSVWENMDDNIRMGYRKFAKFIIDQGKQEEDIEKRFFAYNSGILFCSDMDLKDKDMQILLERGYIKRKYLRKGDSFIYPALQNVMPVAAAYEIMDFILYQPEDAELYNSLIQYSQLFPYPDLTAALVILFMSKRDEFFISRIIYQLYEDEPAIDYSAPKRALIKMEKGVFDIDFSKIPCMKNEEDEGVLLGNTLPWLILSDLLAIPFAAEDGDLSLWMEMMKNVGSFKNVLLRVANLPFDKITGFHVHCFPDKTEVICGKMGIIEPITYAMQMGFLQAPEWMLEIVRWAVGKEEIPLMTRLSISLHVFMEDGNEYLKEARDLLKEGMASKRNK